MLRAYGETASDEEGLVTGLLLPDAPVVVWWPGTAPEVVVEVAARPHRASAASRTRRRSPTRTRRSATCRSTYAPGDTDFAWTRLTLWRAQLAAVLDQPPYEPIDERRGRRRRRLPLDGAPRRLAVSCSSRCRCSTTSRRAPPAPAASTGCGSDRASGVIELEREIPNVAHAVAAEPADARPLACHAGACATASPRNCVGSTPTTCTVR